MSLISFIVFERWYVIHSSRFNQLIWFLSYLLVVATCRYQGRGRQADWPVHRIFVCFWTVIYNSFFQIYQLFYFLSYFLFAATWRYQEQGRQAGWPGRSCSLPSSCGCTRPWVKPCNVGIVCTKKGIVLRLPDPSSFPKSSWQSSRAARLWITSICMISSE